ncbi:MAG TPA: ATP synthase F1 subunit epsilon [Bacteroidota bacterium]|nr:ATP synthase F1 subunit epsilon [Bacteroidota bacterium]
MTGRMFRLEIVTPRRVVFNGEAESFSAPGVMGGFQVLVDHAPMLAEIGIGEVSVRDADGNQVHYATSGGVVEVKHNHVILMAESAEREDEIDAARAEAARDRARHRIAERKAETDIDRARVALMRAVNRLKVSTRG